MVFGMPITIINGGNIPLIIVISYPNSAIIAIVQTTPTTTISTAQSVVLMLLKNIINISATITNDNIANTISSSLTINIVLLLMCGKPEMWLLILYLPVKP